MVKEFKNPTYLLEVISNRKLQNKMLIQRHIKIIPKKYNDNFIL